MIFIIVFIIICSRW